MKKKFIALLAGALLVASMSGNAMASFSAGDLVRVVYNSTTGVEAIADLGTIATLAADTNGTVVGNGAASYLNNGITSASLAGSNVAYFALSGSASSSPLYVSGSTSTATGINGLKMASSGAALENLVAGWGVTAGNNTYTTGITTAAPSYFITANKSGTSVGSLDGFVNTASIPNTEASLASVATQGLWYFANANATTAHGAAAPNGLELQTNLDGTTTVINSNTVAATPIPPAFFLMGSGLLGMFGLRRKKA